MRAQGSGQGRVGRAGAVVRGGAHPPGGLCVHALQEAPLGSDGQVLLSIPVPQRGLEAEARPSGRQPSAAGHKGPQSWRSASLCPIRWVNFKGANGEGGGQGC